MSENILKKYELLATITPVYFKTKYPYNQFITDAKSAILTGKKIKILADSISKDKEVKGGGVMFITVYE